METLKRTLVVLLVIGLVSLALLPLAQTDWADEMRTSSENFEPRLEREGEIPPELAALGGLLKPTLFLLIPGAITLTIHRSIKKASRTAK